MVWRHPDTAIDDPRPSVGSFNMADVRRLSAHVIKLRDMPEGVLVLSGLSRIWKSRVCDPVLQGANRNVMGIHDFLCLPEWIGAEGHVAKRTRSALAQSFGSTTHPSLFVGNDDDDACIDDDDACVEIPLVTPLRSAAMIPSSGNEGRSSAAPTAEGKRVMVDNAVASFAGASRSRPSSGPAPSFRNVSGDAIHTNFFPFSVGLYYCHLSYDWCLLGFAPIAILLGEEWSSTIVDQFPTPGEMVRVESLSDDQLTAKMSVLHCMMMSHGGLKGYGRSCKLDWVELDQVSALKKTCFFGLKRQTFFLRCLFPRKSKGKGEVVKEKDQGELLSLALVAGFEHGFKYASDQGVVAVILNKMLISCGCNRIGCAECLPPWLDTDIPFSTKISGA
ncbi:hypothetical protein Tco_0906499 [Tanacetum coccineum]|uniref:F-box protein n=1 Tax=Tanacetum coccineum TaxID=301880 RepID=A0ABQ5CHT2_9ASTR